MAATEWRRRIAGATARITVLAAAALLGTAQAGVLPDERADLMWHRYSGGGVDVDGPSLLVRKNFLDQLSVTANYYQDNISSASIDVLSTASPYSEKRDEKSIGLEWQRNRTTFSAGYTQSDESDYSASTARFSVSQDFFGDLSTLSLNFSQGDDAVGKNDSLTGERLAMGDIERRQYGIGFSQILSASLIANLGFDHISDEGFLNNPYRSVRYLDDSSPRGYSYQPEMYPATRSSDAFAVRLIWRLPWWRGSLRGEWRTFEDSWAISADTAELRYTHPWRDNWIFELKLRHYRQTAADFYADLFPRANFQNFLARDKELSAFSSETVGLGVTWQLPLAKDHWLDRATLNAYVDFVDYQYDNFRNVTAGGAPGSEPLYGFRAEVLRLFLSVWY